MAVKLRGRLFTDVSKIIDPDRLIDGVGQAMNEVVQQGADRMRDMTQTRGTGRRWSSGWSFMANSTPGREGSYPGRVATGKMLNAVSDNVEVGKGRVSGSFGWISDYEDYMGFQESGFRHNIRNVTVEGMHALRDAGREADEVFYDKIGDAVKNYLAGK